MGKQGVRGNVTLFATVATAEEMRANMHVTIAADYDVADLERIRFRGWESSPRAWAFPTWLLVLNCIFVIGYRPYHARSASGYI